MKHTTSVTRKITGNYSVRQVDRARPVQQIANDEVENTDDGDSDGEDSADSHPGSP